jgi:hypothetical protein
MHSELCIRNTLRNEHLQDLLNNQWIYAGDGSLDGDKKYSNIIKMGLG